jgi:hypothetical protein
VRVRDGEEGERVEAKQGSVPDPDLVVTGDAETFLAVASMLDQTSEVPGSLFTILRAWGAPTGHLWP